MKSDSYHPFANLFGTKSRSPEASPSREVITTASAQPHVLREKMKEQELTHGETVTANISPVRLEGAYGKMAMYFCPMQTLEISEKLTPGDGGDIPGGVSVQGLTVPPGCKPGFYTLKNVTLSSNGVMQVTATPTTSWEVA